MTRQRQLAALGCLGLVLFGGCAHEAAAGRPWLHRLDLRGNRRFADGAIAKGLALQQTGWWPCARRHYFDVGTLRLDRERIVSFYARHGYFDARIVGDTVQPHGKEAVDVAITVAEGDPTRVTSVVVTGLDGLAPALRRRLRRAVPLAVGKVFEHAPFMAAQRLLAQELQERGYAYATATGAAAVNRREHTAAITLTVTPGPLVRFGAVQVVGNGTVPADSIRRRVTFRRGDVYRPRELERSQTRIYGLGVFASVALKLPAAPTATADVTVAVELARRRHELRLGGGVGIERQREEVRLRGEWVVHRFLGGLRTLRLTLKPAYVVLPTVTNIQRQGVALASQIQLVQPDIFHSAFTAQARVGFDLGIQEGYQYYGPRGELGVERSFFRDRLLLAASYDLQFLEFFNINQAAFNPLTTPLGLGFRNPYRLAYLHQSAVLDLRDNRVEPRLGAYLALNLEEGLPEVGGAFRYVKLAPEARGYVPLGSRLVLALRAELGWLRPWSAADSPVTRRFYLGGPAAQRGFSYGRLAPQVRDPVSGRRIPVGGDAEVLFSGELRLGLFRLWGNRLSLVAFCDAGDVTGHMSQLDLAQLHVAVGGDLLYATPVGPIRLGLGVRLNRLGEQGPGGLPNPDPGQRVAFHITIGEAF